MRHYIDIARKLTEAIMSPAFQPNDIFQLRISYSVVTPESAEEGDYDDHGIKDEMDDLNLWQLMYEFRNYGVMANGPHNLTRWWETEPEQNYSDGSDTTYGFHVKVNGRELSDEQRHAIDSMIASHYHVPDAYGEEP
jgi:hypothetical protein